MGKRVLICVAALLLVASVGLAGDKEGNWTGWVTDTMCGAKGNNASHADCAHKCVKEMGAKYALYSSEGKVYVLDPQEKAESLAGKHVKVTGTLAEDTIKVESIAEAPEKSEM